MTENNPQKPGAQGPPRPPHPQYPSYHQYPPHPQYPPQFQYPQPLQPTPETPTSGEPSSSSQRKSSHPRPIMILKRRSLLDPTEPSEKPGESAKSYAEMATKAIKPAGDTTDNLFIPELYDQDFPSLGTEPAAKVTNQKEAGPSKAPTSMKKMEDCKEDLPPGVPNRFNRPQPPPRTSFPYHQRNFSQGGSKEVRSQYIPQSMMMRSVSFSASDNPHFGLTQGSVRKTSYPVSGARSRRLNSGYPNPTRSHIEGYGAKAGEEKDTYPFHNPPTQPANFVRGSVRRHSSYIGRGRGRGRPPTSPGGTPLSGFSWRHENVSNRKRGTAEHGGDRIGVGGLGPPLGERNPPSTPGAPDITRAAVEHSTYQTGVDLGEKDTEPPTPQQPLPKSTTSGSAEHGHQEEEMEPSRPTPKPRTANVAKVQVAPFSGSSHTTGHQADDTSLSKPHDTRVDVQKLGFEPSSPPPPPPPPPSPALVTATHAANFPSRDHRSFPLQKFELPPPPNYFEFNPNTNKVLPLMSQPIGQTQRAKLTADEYFGLQAEHNRPQQTTQLFPPPYARTEGNTMSDNKNTIAGADKVTDADEGYEAIGPSKVVQYAPTVQDKASKAFAGHEKVNFGDIDSKRAAITPGQAVSGNAAFNPPPGFADQRSLFAAQNPEVRLPPRQIHPPPGIPLPPGLPIPASYYQQQGIAPPTGPGNTPFAQPRETAGPPVQTIDNRQAGPGQYRPAYLDMGPFTVGQRSDANDSYLNLNITDAEIKTLNETFAKYHQTKEGIHLLTDRYGRRGAVSEQGSASKGGESAGGPSKPKTIEKDNFKERFEEVFGTKGKVSIQVLQEHQKKRLVAERIRNEMMAAENEKKVPEPVTGNTELFPYPTHGKSDSEVSRELLAEVMKQLSSYVEDEGVTKDVAANKSVYKAGPWKKPPAGKIPDWIGDDNTSFFDQSFGKDYVPEGRQTTGGGGPSNQPVKDAVKLEQTAAKGDGASNTGGSGNQSVGKYDAAKGEQSVGQGQASNTPGNVIFGPPKPPGYPNHMPPREYLRPLKTFEPFENPPPKVRYGLLPANPRSTNTAEKSYINYRGGTVGPIADSAPRYVYGPKGYLELAKDTAPPPPVDPSPFKQPTPSPYAALEQALGTTRFTQGVAEHNQLKTPIPPPGAKPTGGLITDVINGFTRVNYGGRQTQLDPDGSGLPRSEVLKRNQRPGERIGINFYGPNGMEFEIDKTDFNPAEHNTLGGKFKLKSQLRREEEALRAQQSQQPKQTSFEGAQQATPAKGTPVQGKGSGEGSGTRSFFNTPSGGNPQPGPATPGNRGAQGNPEPKRGGKGWHGGMGGRQ